ncbi:MAG: acyl-CoA reductase, partial [Pedobacter sp.]
MPILTAERLIIALKKLSDFIADPDQEFQSLVAIAGNRNAWFTEEQVNNSLTGLRTMLNSADIETWFESIKIQEKPKRVGLI